MTSTAPNVYVHAPDLPADRRLEWLRIAPLLDRCSQHLRSLLRDSAAAHELNERHAMILWLCSADPTGSAQIELAEQLALSPPQLSMLLEQLRQRGLVESMRDPRDRRRQRSLLTASGRQTWDTMAGELGRQLGQYDEYVSSDQFEVLYDLLLRLGGGEATTAPPPEQINLRVLAETSGNESATQEGGQ